MATEPEVRARLAGAWALHVASPFRINAVSPLFSSVLLGLSDAVLPQPQKESGAQAIPPAPRPQTPVDSSDDGALELREVMNMELRAGIAVFSDGAAASMRDGASATDVLQWGWLAAGVPSLLVARWSSPRAAGSRLLAEFHKHLQSGMAPGAAPVHWAGWMLVSAR
jgi:hypothetical protein